MLVVEKFIRSLVEKYGNIVCIQMVVLGIYSEACKVLKLKHYTHLPLENNLIENLIQYFKDRTKSFDDYYPYIKNECNLFHIYNWIQFFVSMYNIITTSSNDFNFEFN